MLRALCLASVLAVTSGVALADEKPSAEEMKKITTALDALGCKGGDAEKESEGTGVFEVDDAQCKGGQMDVKFTKDFKLHSITAD